MNEQLEKAKLTTHDLGKNRYKDAKWILLSGSIVRGEGTPSSDLDLIVIYNNLDAAYRESFMHQGFPIESFVHDLQTLRFYSEDFDKKRMEPVMATMITESLCIKGDRKELSPLIDAANIKIQKGAPPLTNEQIDLMRYSITDRVDDLRHPRSIYELQATAVQLYDQVSDFYFRTRNLWCARGKHIPRKIADVDEVFAKSFTIAFEELFKGEPRNTILLCETMLEPFGGTLFDGFHSRAPSEARKT